MWRHCAMCAGSLPYIIVIIKCVVHTFIHPKHFLKFVSTFSLNDHSACSCMKKAHACISSGCFPLFSFCTTCNMFRVFIVPFLSLSVVTFISRSFLSFSTVTYVENYVDPYSFWFDIQTRLLFILHNVPQVSRTPSESVTKTSVNHLALFVLQCFLKFLFASTTMESCAAFKFPFAI